MSDIEKAQGGVPAPAVTPALEIIADDVAISWVYIGQFSSTQVQDGHVEAGSLFTALGQDDPDPVILEEPVTLHVLALTKGKSLSVDGKLSLFDYNDPDAPPDAWVTYNYVVALPEHDPDVPYKWLLTRSATPTAKSIQFVLERTASAGRPPFAQAWELSTKGYENENSKGKWWTPQAKIVKPKKANITIAEKLSALSSSDPATAQVIGEGPT